MAAPLDVNVIDVTKSPYTADPTGATDSTTTIQNALNDAVSGRKSVFIPQGIYWIQNELTLASAFGVDIFGEGTSETADQGATLGPRTVLFGGANMAKAFILNLDKVGGCTVRDIHFLARKSGSSLTPPTSLLQIVKSTDGVGTGLITLRNVKFSGYSGYTGTAVSVGVSGQNNCADILYERLGLANLGTGIQLNNTQSVNHLILQLNATSVKTVIRVVRGGCVHVHMANLTACGQDDEDDLDALYAFEFVPASGAEDSPLVAMNSLRGVRFEALADGSNKTARVLRAEGNQSIAVYDMLEAQDAAGDNGPLMLVRGASLSLFNSRFKTKPLVGIRFLTGAYWGTARAIACHFEDNATDFPHDEWLVLQTSSEVARAYSLCVRSKYPTGSIVHNEPIADESTTPW